jgi:hypothetical protein
MAYTTINKSTDYFNTVTYTGDGTTNQTKAITFGFQPDFTWFKARDAGQSHILVDSVRGGTKAVITEVTNSEYTLAVAQLFTSTGMIVSNDAGANSLNSSGSSKVSWGWKANGAGVANTAGTISSTVSANTTSGFSIVTYTSPNSSSDQTVGHGLGVAPSFIITKNLDTSYNWDIHHKSLSSGNGLIFTSAVPRAGVFGSMTSTTFGTKDSYTHASTNRYIAYCFAEIKGFSKFGSYTGNGSTDGTFVYTGFKPAFLIAKRTDSTGNWRTRDNKRSPYNAVELVLNPNISNTETTEDAHDFLSNGFKVRTTGPENNASGGTFIYMAFAEQPLVGTNNVPCTAR